MKLSRRLLWTTGILGLPLVLFIGFTVGLPWVLMTLGMGREYGWSVLRVGHKEFQRQVDLSGGEGIQRAYSGPLFALRGERVWIDYRVQPEAGSVGLSVSKLFDAGPPAWEDRFEAPVEERAAVVLESTGLYQVIIGYRSYLGHVELDWNVESPP